MTLGREGDLAPAFSIFERYQQNLTTRLEGSVVENLPDMVAAFDYTLVSTCPQR